MNKAQSLSRITHTRQSLLGSIQGLREADFTAPQVEGIWTIKDLLGHIAAWEEACLVPLESFAAGGPFQSQAIPDHDAWNALQAAKRRGRPLPEILKELNEVRQRLLEAAGRLDSEGWRQTLSLPWGEAATVAGMLSGLAWHEAEHAKSIWAWRKR